MRIDVTPPDVDSLMQEYLDWSLARATDDETRSRWRRDIAGMEGPETAASSRIYSSPTARAASIDPAVALREE